MCPERTPAVNCPTPEVLYCWICGRQDVRSTNCGQQRDVPTSRAVISANLANVPCPQRVMLPERYAAVKRPITTQPSRRKHLTSTLRNETKDLSTQSSSPLKVNSGNPPSSQEILETPSRSDMEQSPKTHRNLRPPCNETRKNINASSGPIANHTQRSQRRHASYHNPHLVESGHACPTDKQVNFEETTPSTRLNAPPGSDQHIASPIVANVDTRPLPLRQRSDILMSQSQRYKISDTTLRQQELHATPDGTAPVLKQQSSLRHHQVATEITTQVSPTLQRLPTYSNVNIVTPLQQYNNNNDNITRTTVKSTTTTVTTSPSNRVLLRQQRQHAQRNAINNINGGLLNGTGRLRSCTHPATAVVENETAGNIKVTGNENKILYETEIKRISSHSPIPNGMMGNINNISNQPQQLPALPNQPLLQANVTKHALTSLVTPSALTYKITDLIKKATNNVSEQQQQTQSQQQTAPQRKGLSSSNKHIHKVIKEIYSPTTATKSSAASTTYPNNYHHAVLATTLNNHNNSVTTTTMNSPTRITTIITSPTNRDQSHKFTIRLALNYFDVRLVWSILYWYLRKFQQNCDCCRLKSSSIISTAAKRIGSANCIEHRFGGRCNRIASFLLIQSSQSEDFKPKWFCFRDECTNGKEKGACKYMEKHQSKQKNKIR
uniref:Uncharacterized protein n=1 Tax=Glossina austeni TaxID=7395 RepID=A0A1A9VH04_GLOAU